MSEQDVEKGRPRHSWFVWLVQLPGDGVGLEAAACR